MRTMDSTTGRLPTTLKSRFPGKVCVESFIAEGSILDRIEEMIAMVKA